MEKNACLVVLTDTRYLPGTRRLLESWDNHNPILPVVALSHEPTALQAPFLLKRCAQRIAIDPQTYVDIKPYKKRRSMRHAQTFYKFEAFSNFGYDINLFLDSDILCLRPAPRLLHPSNAQLQAAPDTGFKKTRGYKGHANEINSGVLVIDRSIQGLETINALKEIALNNPGRGGYNAGDQGIINKWIHRNSIRLELLPSSYNLIKKDYADQADLETCQLLHFAAHKPWFDNPSHPSKPLERLWVE